MSRPNDNLIDKLETIFENPGNRGFYANCTMYIPFDELCRMVGYSLMYGREPNKHFSLQASQYMKKRRTITPLDGNDKLMAKYLGKNWNKI